MSRHPLVAGNWKMNKRLDEALALTKDLAASANNLSDTVEIVLAPPALYLHPIQQLTQATPGIHLAAQNCHQASKGAYTGELSAPMLRAMEINYVILGHSERRSYFQEDNVLLAKKVNAALGSGVKVIFCCGEPLEVREQEGQEAYVQQQLEESLFQRTVADLEQVVIAYEPIWAIGTGRTASPVQAQAMHAFIRQLLSNKYGANAANQVRLLYGGSCKPSNAAALFAQPDVDGALVGGASLQASDFISIIEARKTASTL
ncbi:MAG: triose-phosphate isomerase [Aureispira sp.]